MDNIEVREGVLGDFNFIISTWLRSYKHSSYFAKRIRNSIFFFFHHEIVVRLLNLPSTKVLVACDPLDTNVIFGYLVHGKYQDEDVVHYVYVKSAFREMGVAKALVEASSINLNKFSFSHWTFAVDGLVEKLPGAVFVPYLI